jgi:tetratricopeptide (TPR) repeat protein
MKILPSEISGDSYVIYDKGFLLDENHVSMLNFKEAHYINLPRTEHGSVRVLAKSKSILEIIELVLNKKCAIDIQNKLTRYRRFIPEYYQIMILLASKRHRWTLVDNLFLKAQNQDLATLPVKRKYAESLAKQKRYKKSLIVLNELEDNHALNQYATYLIADGQYSKAITVLSKITSETNNLSFYRNLAKAYELNGDINSAVACLTPFELEQSKNPDFLCHLGRLLTINNQIEHGRKLCQIAVDLRPTEPFFLRVLNAIK